MRKARFGMIAVFGVWAAFALAACDQKSAENEVAGVKPDEVAKISLPPQVKLAPFDALYNLSLRRGSELSSVAAYSGLLILTLEETCDGYVTTQRITAEIGKADDDLILSDFYSTSWEAHDASEFHFNMVNRFNNRVYEEVDGKASRADDHSIGEVSRLKPNVETFELPARTQLPTQYSLSVLEAAVQGKSIYHASMFDGAEDVHFYDVMTFIGKAQKYVEDDGGIPAMTGLTYWPINMSYHDPDAKESLPRFELSMRMYENGLASHLVLDYGDFALDGELVKLEMLEAPVCD